MKMKSKIIALAALTLPTIIAVAPIQEASAESITLTQTVYKVDNGNVALDFDYFTSALNANVLSDLDIDYIQLSNGKYYSFSNFTSAHNAFGSLEEATAVLSSDNRFEQTLSNVTSGKVDVDSGKVIASQPTTSPSVFRVIDIE